MIIIRMRLVGDYLERMPWLDTNVSVSTTP
jgi:hypothetical protein